MSRRWTPSEYALLATLAPNWPLAARVLHRNVRSCRERWAAGPPAPPSPAAPPPEDRRALLALLLLGHAGGLTVAETIEYFHVLSRHQDSSWRGDGRYVRTGHWEAS